jgi:hypothetical protein
MVDAVETLSNVGVQTEFGFIPDFIEDGFNRIMTGSSYSEPV